MSKVKSPKVEVVEVAPAKPTKVKPEQIEAVILAFPEVAEFRNSELGQSFVSATPKKRPTHLGLTAETTKLIAGVQKESGVPFRIIEAAFGLRPARGMTAYRCGQRAKLIEKEEKKAARAAEKIAAAEAADAILFVLGEAGLFRRANAKAAAAQKVEAPVEVAPIEPTPEVVVETIPAIAVEIAAAETATEMPAVVVHAPETVPADAQAIHDYQSF